MIIGRCQRSHDVVEPRLKTQWFVRTKPLAEAALARHPDEADGHPARTLREGLGALAYRDPRLEREPPALVGPPDPGLVLPGRPRDGEPGDGRARCLRGLRPSGGRADPGSRHLRHLVQLGAVAVLDARLAGGDAGPGPLLPGHGHGDGLRHHLLLGGPDDDAGHPPRGRRARSRSSTSPAWSATRTARRCRRRRATSSTRSRRSTSRAPTRSASRSSTAPPRATTRSSAPRSWRTPATSPTSSGTPPGSCWAPAPRRSRRTPRDGAPDPAHLGPAERWLRSRVAATVAAADRALADYAFGQLTATLYDAIWGEYCDWALELAKVRLADESLPAADREATWWTLVEALDTYLRLLHPVMPFLTEAIWGQLPRAPSDPELLIVADWPAAGRRRRRGRRRDRRRSSTSCGRSATPAPRPGSSRAPGSRSTWPSRRPWRPPSTTLRPALERLARARPLVRVADRGRCTQTRGAASPSWPATWRPSSVPVAVGRPRRPPAIAPASRRSSPTPTPSSPRRRARLADERFTAKAPPAVVEGARTREAELAERAARVRARLED